MVLHGDRLNCNLVGFSDSDWAGDLNSRRSVLGYAFILCGAVITWSAKKQQTIALSSTEAEYMVMTHSSVGRKMVHYMTCLWRLVSVNGIHHYYCRTRIPSEGGLSLEIPTISS